MRLAEAVKNADQPLDVVVVGEALTDIVNSATGTSEHPGGSPANVAYGLGRLGIRTGLLTALGDDARGTAIREHLQRANVEVMPESCALDRTATATVTLADDGSAKYRFDIGWELNGSTTFQAPTLIHTGSIATFLQPGAAAVKSLLQKHRRDCIISYDPNIRPALLGGHVQALETFEEVAGLSHVVKLSDEDAHWLYPHLDIEASTQHILRMGPGLVVATRGSAGSLLATRDTTLEVPSVKSRVVDTIGAGDSYMAALLMTLVHAGTVRDDVESLRALGGTASMAAAITVGRAGANPPSTDELGARLLRERALV